MEFIVKCPLIKMDMAPYFLHFKTGKRFVYFIYLQVLNVGGHKNLHEIPIFPEIPRLQVNERREAQ